MVKDNEYIEAKRKTRFGKIIDGTEYGQYSIENEFLRDNETFIEKKSGNCDFLFSFIYKNSAIGVWANYNAGVLDRVDSLLFAILAFTFAITFF